MRVTGGYKKGFVLVSPKGKNIRPASDHIRQVIFNIIGHDLSNKMVLDLFSGTAILGIEALSRGAKHAYFVDKSSDAIELIIKNLQITGYKDKATIIKMNIIKKPLRLKEKFDIIFVDPPYNTHFLLKALSKLPVKKIMRDEAIIIGRSSKRESLPENINQMSIIESRNYGDTKLWFYKYEGKNEKENSCISWNI